MKKSSFLLLSALLLGTAPALSQAAPPFDGISYADLQGKPHGFEAWRGRVVVVNFWATWCAPCREEMPMLNTFSQKWGPHGVTVVGVAIDDKVSVRNFVNQFGITYPVLIGDQSAMNLLRAAGNKVGALPFTAVLDRSGRQVASLTGRLNEAQLEAAVRPRL